MTEPSIPSLPPTPPPPGPPSSRPVVWVVAIAGVVALAVVVAIVAAVLVRRDPSPDATATPTPGGSTTAPPPSSGPGAPGIGDSYFPLDGNGGYDVADYDLAVTYDPATDGLTGVATITATATQELTRFDLDFEGLTIDELTIDGAAATFDRDGAELVVTPPSAVASGGVFVTRVAYHGTPETAQDPLLGALGVLHTNDGVVAIGEPDVAAYWFPVNDHPRDKATYTIAITAPDGLEALANGVLMSREPAAQKTGWTTWTWFESKPMASYLATMVVGDYRLHESTHDGVPVVTAVDTSLPQSVDTTLARTPEVIDFLATQFGPYPFDAMGGIVVDDSRIRFALENQTRPIYSWAFFGGGDDTWVLAHELAHQWYGDSVSVRDWSDIWLNEGFATYAEWLWDEHSGGLTPQEWFDNYYEDPSAAMWRVPPANPGVDDLFHDSVYTRGGLTLQALRKTVGDDAFFEIIQSWAAQKADGTGSTPEFIALAEEVSGQELDSFFQGWLYDTRRPPKP